MFSDPIKNLKAFGFREDHIVADLGAGTGHYTLPVAELVPKGKVYAVDIQKDYLTIIKNRAIDSHLHNVEIIWGNVEKRGGTKIGDGVVDAVIVSNVLFQVEDRVGFIDEIKRILRPKGRVLFVDWSPESILQIKSIIPKNKALSLFEKAGFALEQKIDAGEHHYGMILRKQ